MNWTGRGARVGSGRPATSSHPPPSGDDLFSAFAVRLIAVATSGLLQMLFPFSLSSFLSLLSSFLPEFSSL